MTIYIICSKCDKPKSSIDFYKNCKQCKECHKEYYKIYYQNNKQSYKDRYDPVKGNEYNKRYNKKKRRKDPLFKLKGNIRSYIYQSVRLKGYGKNTKTYNILGCEWIVLKEHIESQFDEFMNWENYGSYWDIDHIIPLSLGKTEDEILKLSHYTNLQPLNSYYNRHIKRAKFEKSI